jgi:hypothetical protein
MRIMVQITIQSDEAESEVAQEVVRLERGPLQPETLGFSLTEARSILAGLEQILVEQQSAEFIAQARRYPRCGRERACKGHQQIVFRTPFGKLKVDSPQLSSCPCQSPGPTSVSLLAERLPERTSPELTYLETKFAALVSYGLSRKLLNGVLPIGQCLSVTAIRNQVHRRAERLETERAQGQPVFEHGVQAQDALPEAAVPRAIDLDGGYVHAKGQPSRTESWFKVIVGKRLASEGQTVKCFAFVGRCDAEPKGRQFDWLTSPRLATQPGHYISVRWRRHGARAFPGVHAASRIFTGLVPHIHAADSDGPAGQGGVCPGLPGLE